MSAPAIGNIDMHPITHRISSDIEDFVHTSVPQLIDAIETYAGEEPASVTFKVKFIPATAKNDARVESEAKMTVPTGRAEHGVEVARSNDGNYQMHLLLGTD